MLNVMPSFVYLLLLFYIPMVLLLVISFWKSGFMSLEPAFTFDNYRKFFQNPNYLKILWNTLIVTSGSMALLFVIGYPIGYYLGRMVKRYGSLILFLMIIPVEIGFLVRIYAWKIILSKTGIISSFLVHIGLLKEPARIFLYSRTAIILVLIHEWLPYVVIPVTIALKGIDPSTIEAARDLGASGFTIFRKIIFPLSIPGLFAAFVLIFIPMLGEFAIPTIVGGSSNYMLGNIINNQFMAAGNWGFGSAIGVILLSASVLLIALVIKISGLEKLL
jgi:spermidine/putrescine transport system permease protein